ncbi:cytochrome P450 [Neobacillus sp. MM2021_6]|uniref:cytochrome P450 n=1 Tax=Bacillaceae TaxID=186817 RepID=UPI00140A3021|nr:MULTISPECIES: cytochrome P450 [Bacillaceae]MBO0961873.1 cytochrome P450 [Neobacillus sp. MM2021_6]NHC18960.1 cytochrome P450 [Bacillus sp. MM2020_4]
MLTTAIDSIPQPKTYGPLGNLPQLDLEQPSQSIMKLAYEYGPIFKLKFPTGTGIFISSAELVEDASDESRFDKLVNAPLQKVRSFSGDGLFTSWTKEDNWQKAHNILLPSFSQSAMKGYHSMMVDIALQLIQKWSRLNSDESIDVPEDMTRLTLDTIGLCGFNYRFNSFYREKPHRFIKSMGRALDEAMNQSNRLGVQDKLMVKKKRQFNRDIQYMFSLVDRIIEERKSSDDHDGEDLLSRMLDCADPVTGEKLSDENIRYQIITFLIAGHETTSGLLSFALYFLMKHPKKLTKAYEEVDRVLTGPIPTYQQVRQLKYVRMILNESLRLWPTAPLFSLYAKEDTVLAGKYPLKRRDVVNILLPKLHRDPNAWGDDVEEFKPERFEDPKKVPHHAYKPFGNGQRACIGQQFAMHEATLLLGMILKHFELVDHTNYQLKIKETLTFKPEKLTMQVRPRESHSSVPLTQDESNTAKDLHGIQSIQMNQTIVHAHNTPLLVLYGSNMGTAEGIARDITLIARFKGFQCEVAPLDEYVGRLPKDGAVFIITASYNGNATKNARKFVKWLKEEDSEVLTGVKYAVFGCGDTNWASTYQSIPNFIDEKLTEKGATRLVQKGQGDASSDFEKQFENWHDLLWPKVFHAFGIEVDDLANHTGKSLTVQFVTGEQETASVAVVSSKAVIPAVLAQNSSELVERVLKRFALEQNKQLIISGDREAITHLPLNFPVRTWDLLKFSVNLQETVTQSQLHELVEITVCPPHKQELEMLLNEQEYELNVVKKNISMLDLLEKYPACELSFERFIELLSPLQVQ